MATFLDPGREALLRTEGSATLDLPPGLVDDLRAAVADLRPDRDERFHNSTLDPDPVYRRAVVDRLRPLAERFLPAFDRHEVFHVALLRQPVGDAGHEQPHQDWAYVDEERHRSVTVWIPLVDVGVGEGCLLVLPGSHRVLPLVRPNGLDDPSFGLDATDLVPRPVRRGTALVYDHALLHASGPHRGPATRDVVAFLLKPQVVPIVHFHPVAEGRVERLESDDASWLLDLDPAQPPPGMRSAGVRPVQRSGLGPEQLLAPSGGTP